MRAHTHTPEHRASQTRGGVPQRHGESGASGAGLELGAHCLVLPPPITLSTHRSHRPVGADHPGRPLACVLIVGSPAARIKALERTAAACDASAGTAKQEKMKKQRLHGPDTSTEEQHPHFKEEKAEVQGSLAVSLRPGQAGPQGPTHLSPAHLGPTLLGAGFHSRTPPAPGGEGISLTPQVPHAAEADADHSSSSRTLQPDTSLLSCLFIPNPRDLG